MPVQTSASPTTLLNEDRSQVPAWVAPAQSNSLAIADIAGQTYPQYGVYNSTDWLKLTGWNFSIPAGATIEGIFINLALYNFSFSNQGDLSLGAIQLVKGGLITGTPKFPNSILPYYTNVQAPNLSAGASTDMWGLALSPADVNNNANFGFAFYVDAFNANARGDPQLFYAAMTVYYSVAADVTKDVTTQVSVLTGITRDVLTSVAVIKDNSIDVATTVSVGIGVNVTYPTNLAVVSSAAFNVTWVQNPGIQSDYRVRIYSDAAGTVVVYDSGVVGSSLQTHAIPAGALPSPMTLYVRVNVTNTDLTTGMSTLVQFSTSFPTGRNIVNLTARVMGCRADARSLPFVLLSWEQITPAVGESFAQYDIRRREAGDALFRRIATVTSISTTVYRDTTAAPGTAYEYAVVYEAASGASTLISANQSPAPWAQLDFDHAFVHDPVTGTYVRLDAWDATVDVQDDITFNQPWGQPTPNAYFGERNSHKISIPLHPQLLQDQRVWQQLAELRRLQREAGATLCLRLGRSKERYFVMLTAPQKRNQQMTYESGLEFQETFFDEAV